MPVAIAILRGINVGGHRQIKMADLRRLCESLSFRNVETLIQSGNVVFELKASEVKTAARRIEDAIEKEFGFRAGVVLRTAADLRQILAANPFAGRANVNPAGLLICFSGARPAVDCGAKLAAIKVQSEEIHLVGSELFIHFAGGMGKSALSENPMEGPF
jgi:uncharacterized protein (DUF1697 family)